MALAITEKYKGESDFSEKMELDLHSISSILKSSSPDWATITFPSPVEMQQLLSRIYALSLNNKSTKLTNHKLLRIYLFLISRYQEKIWPSVPAGELISFNNSMKKLSETIGVVPRLSHPVVWADQKFLPPEINRKTKENWQRQSCLNPRRGTTISRNEIHFIGTPRDALKDGYSAVSTELVKAASGDDLYLNLIDFDYYKLGLMDADHLLASSHLLSRLKEMIEVMNYDPKFADEMKNSIFNDGYFITDSSGTIVGNYWLYMAYHNSIENLWLLLASDNSGAGKGAVDPIVWLNQLEIGKQYLQHLEEEGKYVDKSDILYRVSTGGMSMSLKDSFTSWVRESRRDHILVYQGEAKLHQKMREKISNAGNSRESLMEVHGNIAVVRAHFFDSDADSEESSFTSVGSSTAGQFAQQFVEAITQDPAAKELMRDAKKRIKELGSDTKKTVKKQRLGI